MIHAFYHTFQHLHTTCRVPWQPATGGARRVLHAAVVLHALQPDSAHLLPRRLLGVLLPGRTRALQSARRRRRHVPTAQWLLLRRLLWRRRHVPTTQRQSHPLTELRLFLAAAIRNNLADVNGTVACL